jgi:hypothetical protein
METDMTSALHPVPKSGVPCAIDGAPRSAGITPAARKLSQLILSSGTATSALLQWCVAHGLGEGPILARRQPVPVAPRPDDDLFDALGLARGETVRHRRVTLHRGEVPLSDCDLWWLPDRLPARILRALNTTDQPFGTVVVPLAPVRRTLFESFAIDGPHVLEQRAIVEGGLGRRRPIAAVRELYRAGLVQIAAATAETAVARFPAPHTCVARRHG